MGKKLFGKLLEPGQIGKMKIKNRIFKTGANSTLGDSKSAVTERLKSYYGAIARGGVGFIVVEGSVFDDPSSANIPPGVDGFLRASSDKVLESVREITDTIHRYDCPAFLQLMYGGATLAAPRIQPVSSSALTIDELKDRHPYHKDYLLKYPPPRAITIGEIGELVTEFGKRAEEARDVGFDGIEVNACNGHMLNSFLSRVWNRREDKYGCQSVENRSRIVVEIIREIKNRLGQDYPVTVLYNAAEYGIEKCTTLEEGVEFARFFQSAGADAIQTRVHGYLDITMDVIWPERVFIPEPPVPLPKDMDWSHRGAGSHLPLAAAVKKAVTVPVLVAGRVDLDLAENALKQGKADFIGMTRRLQADPELPHKIASGSLEDIAPCTACSHCLDANVFRRPLVCRVNAAIGGDKEYTINPADKKKRILVVGGGPAAMEAARVSAIRGHEVLLFEKQKKLGGLMPLASLVKGTEIEDLPALVHYLERQIKKLNVKINLGKEFTPSLAEEINPDVVILATGGIPDIPEIPGIKRRNVVSGARLHRQLKTLTRFISPNILRELTRLWMPLGKRIVIIGGAIQGLELAEFLVKRGRKVTILESSDTLGDKMPVRNKIKTLKWLEEKGNTILSGVKYEEITDKGIIINTGDSKRRLIEADSVVIALPLKADTLLLKALEGKCPQVYAIGDCKEPRLILHAIADGHRVANVI